MVEMFNQTVYRPVAHSFLTDETGMGGSEHPRSLLLPLYVTAPTPNQEQLRLLIISSPTWVRETIHDLHGRSFANARDWSSLQPGANPGEVVSILTRRRSRR